MEGAFELRGRAAVVQTLRVERCADALELGFDPNSFGGSLRGSCLGNGGLLAGFVDLGLSGGQTGSDLRFDVAPGFGLRDLPEVLSSLEDGVGNIGRRRERPRILQPTAEALEPGVEHRADRVGRAAADLLAYALDRRPFAGEQ